MRAGRGRTWVAGGRGLALTALLGVAALLPGAPATAEPAPAWGPCPAEAGAEKASCATVSVPMNYADPDGARIEVMVSRIPALDPARSRGALFGNPGGPGGDSLSFWSGPSTRVPQLREFDLFAVQPRGLRWSTPLSCSSLLDIAPITDRAACEVARPGYPATVTSESVARDMDAVREALGLDRISFFGVSWGTYLGAVYATLFPGRVDKLVLDSNVDPNVSWVDQVARVPAGVADRLNDIFDWIAANDSIYGLGATREEVLAEWKRQSASQSGGWSSPIVGATTYAAYGRSAWPYLAQGMREYRDDPEQLRFLKYLARPAAVSDMTSGWMRDATRCNEDSGLNPAALTTMAVTLLTDSDPFAQQEALMRAGITCAAWPQTTRRVPVDGAGLAVRPMLVQSPRDPATSGAPAMAAALGGDILWVEGGDHGHFTRPNPTLNTAVLHYLRTGEFTIDSAPEAPITTPNPPTVVPGAR
ncbi:alpha/beta fold hydrolase [Nocardia sp. NPDC005978]|uniref:alpha/beta fold hydrolase n=1 Tax=Nocardia sp. NPDC005978 TaxID=3156725 RepID=UPI0033B2FE7A